MTDDLAALVRQGVLTPSQASAQREKLQAKFQERLVGGFLTDGELSPLYDEIVSRPDPSPTDSSHSSPDVAAVRKNKSGRKRMFVDAHWAILEAETYRLLYQHGGLTEDDPKFNSIAKLIKQLQDFAQAHPKFKEVGGAPEKETMRERVNCWIEEWKARRAAGN